MRSTQRSTLRATSAMDSRSPRGEFVWSTKIALPPIVLKPASKLRRVLRLAFSNMRTICFASSAWRYSRGLRLTSCPSLRIARTSLLDRSAMEHMSSPASRAAAARISGSFSTASSWRSMVALLATVLSSCGVDGLRTARGGSMFRKDFVQRSDGGVHMRALENVGWQEAQDRVARAVDKDVPLEHFRHGEFGEVSGIQLGSEHQALAAHIGDCLMACGERAKLLLKVIAHISCLGQQAFPLNRINYSDCNGASQRTTTKRGPMHAGVNRSEEHTSELQSLRHLV